MLSPFPRWCPYCGRLDVELLNVQAPTRHNPAGDLDSYGRDKEEVAGTPSGGVTPLASTNTPAVFVCSPLRAVFVGIPPSFLHWFQRF